MSSVLLEVHCYRCSENVSVSKFGSKNVHEVLRRKSMKTFTIDGVVCTLLLHTFDYLLCTQYFELEGV